MVALQILKKSDNTRSSATSAVSFRFAWCFALLVMVSPLQADTIRAALVAKTNITIRDVVVDSFDSSDPNYSTNGNYTPDTRKAGGNVVVTENQPNSILSLQSSANVYGKAYIAAPYTTVFLGPTSSLGSTLWIDSGTLGVEPESLVEHPGGFILDAPTVPFTNGLPLPAKSTHVLMGSNYVNSYLLTSGNYKLTNLNLTSTEKLLVLGDVKIHFAGSFRMSGQSQVRIATNSSLTVYAATNIDLAGGGVINHTRFASNVTFYGLDTCTSVKYAGGADFIGTFYAPTAVFEMGGGGTSVYHLAGSVTASSIKILGKYQIHLDEALPAFLVYPKPPGNLSQPVITANGQFQFKVTGPGLWVIQASTNLTDWTPITVQLTTSVFTTNVAFPQMYFRAVPMIFP